METNIWENLNFIESDEKSAYDLLIKQADFLTVKTSGELKMSIEAVDAYSDTELPKLTALYILYIVVPKLGNYRRKVLTVFEDYETGRFPVSIFSHIDNIKIENVENDNFIDKIEEILSKPRVKRSIENLYRQSKEIK